MNPFRAIPRSVYVLGGVAIVAVAATAAFVYSTLQVRYTRDISRIVFNRNWDLLDRVKRGAGVTADSLRKAMAEATPGPDVVAAQPAGTTWLSPTNATVPPAVVTTAGA